MNTSLRLANLHPYSSIIRHGYRPVPPGFQLPPAGARTLFVDTNSFPRVEVLGWIQEQFRGPSAQYMTVSRPDTVVVMPVLPMSEAISLGLADAGHDDMKRSASFHGDNPNVYIAQLEKQPHWQESKTGFSAGKVDPGEEPVAAARRELREELGLCAEKMQLVFLNAPAPGYDWVVYYYVATGITRAESAAPDNGEEISPRPLFADAILKKVRSGALRASSAFLERLLITGAVRNHRELDSVMTQEGLARFDVEQKGYWWAHD